VQVYATVVQVNKPEKLLLSGTNRIEYGGDAQIRRGKPKRRSQQPEEQIENVG